MKYEASQEEMKKELQEEFDKKMESQKVYIASECL